MASVFLSYDRDDVARARQFARVLEQAGHQVWWDTQVRGGAQFSKVIEQALAAAEVVVVLWSKNSVESAWVRDEAGAGRDTARLVPVTIDGTGPPIGFRQFQAIDLSRWKGRGRPAQLEMFLTDVAEMAKGGERAPAKVELTRIRSRLASWPWTAAASGLAVLAAAAAIIVWSPWNLTPAVPTVLVTAGRNDGTSQALARDLAVRLGNIPAVQSGSLRLVSSDPSSSEQPALVFELTSRGDGQSSEATLLLRSADDALIWSGSFEQGQRSADDMELQMALTATRVLGCETDVLAEPAAHLSQQGRKLYLTSCAEAAEGAEYDPQPIIANLSKLVAKAPGFAAAWRRLLIAEAQLVDEQDDPQPTSAHARTLRSHIAAARRLEPHMPEATVAEISLLPRSDLVSRMRLIDRAFQDDPNNTVVLVRRTQLLQHVGRMGEAVGTALGAIMADPTSPAVLNNYISALAYDGQTDMAEQQLKRAERLWPGTSTLADIQWRFYLRFGDPKIGLQLASEQPSLTPSQMLFLQARSQPTKENVDKLISFYTTHLNGDP
jgi:hypothetical protein